MAFSPDGWRLASASSDRSVRIWDTTADHEVTTLTGHLSLVYQVAFSPGTRTWRQPARTAPCAVWDRFTGEEVLVLRGHTADVFGVAYSPDGRLLASASADRTVRIWDVATGQQRACMSGHTDVVWNVVFSPDGRWLASSSTDRTVRIWPVDGGTAAQTLRGHGAHVRASAFSPNGQRLASASDDQTLRIWDTASGKELLVLRGHPVPVCSVVFSPDGLTLASTGEDRTVRVWDAATGQEKLSLQGLSAPFREVAFSPDGRRLVAAGGDHVKIWDALTGQELFLLHGRLSQISSVAFSPDGFQLAGAGKDHGGNPAVVVWDGEPPTSEMRERSAAISLVRWLFTTLPTSEAVLARLQNDNTLRESVRQHALSFVRPCAQARDRARAEQLVYTLFNRALLRPEVLANLRADGSLEGPVRQEALLLAEQFVESAVILHNASRLVARRPDADEAAYHLALRQAETACRLAPYERKYQSTCGILLYRLHRYADALAALTRFEETTSAPAASADPAELAFLAMTQHQLGRQEQAQATLQQFKEVMLKSPGVGEDESLSFGREAEACLNSARSKC